MPRDISVLAAHFTHFLTHYVFQTYIFISSNQMHVIVTYESNTEKLRSVHLAKNQIKKKKTKSVKEQEFCRPSGSSF